MAYKKNSFLTNIISDQQSHWLKPTLIALALVATFIGVTGWKKLSALCREITNPNNRIKNRFMNTKNSLIGKTTFTSALAVAFALAMWSANVANAAEPEGGMGQMGGMSGKEMPPKNMRPGGMPGMDSRASQSSMNMSQIKTQAEAEALKPGDSMSMTCSKCKTVMVQKVGTDQAHVKMMTVGDKATCSECGGTVEVVGTGKGEGKNEEVKHVCSKCGDDAMFCSATKPGSGSMPPMNMK
jgi:hypothetical protein